MKSSHQIQVFNRRRFFISMRLYINQETWWVFTEIKKSEFIIIMQSKPFPQQSAVIFLTDEDNGTRAHPWAFQRFHILKLRPGRADGVRLPKTTRATERRLQLCRNGLFQSGLWRRWLCRRSLWTERGHCHLSPAVLFKGVFVFKNVSKPSSSGHFYLHSLKKLTLFSTNYKTKKRK